MNLLLPIAVLLLMLSVGMSLNARDLVANWRRLTPAAWARLVAVTFLLPPLLALALGRLFALGPAATTGLFLIGVAPGAPLMTRGVAKRGFDSAMAASYQLWGALLIPVMIPLLVAAAGRCYGREIRIPPGDLFGVIVKQQFLPLLGGMALRHFLPDFSTRVRHFCNLAGNILLTVVIAALLWKMGPALRGVSPWVFVAALLLAAGCMAVSRALLPRDPPEIQTLVISNINRHAGLALLLSGGYLHDKSPLPAIACYAAAAPVVMGLFAKFARPSRPSVAPVVEAPAPSSLS